VLVVLNAILFSLGPSAQQRRACEMYGDASSKIYLANVEKYFNRPKVVAEIEAHNARFTEESRTRQFGQWLNEEASDVVSARLSISLREVAEALEKCRKAKTRF
jgi:hypothetical protein